MAAVPPAPRARVSTARKVYVGRLARRRAEYRRSMIQLPALVPRSACDWRAARTRSIRATSSAAAAPARSPASAARATTARRCGHVGRPGRHARARDPPAPRLVRQSGGANGTGAQQDREAQQEPDCPGRTTRLQVIEHSRVILQCRNQFRQCRAAGPMCERWRRPARLRRARLRGGRGPDAARTVPCPREGIDTELPHLHLGIPRVIHDVLRCAVGRRWRSSGARARAPCRVRRFNTRASLPCPCTVPSRGRQRRSRPRTMAVW